MAYTSELLGVVHLFSYDYIALYPPNKVVNYLVKYVSDTPAQNQIPSYQICRCISHISEKETYHSLG